MTNESNQTISLNAGAGRPPLSVYGLCNTRAYRAIQCNIGDDMRRALLFLVVLICSGCAKQTAGTHANEPGYLHACETTDYKVKVTLSSPTMYSTGKSCSGEATMVWLLKSMPAIRSAYCKRLLEKPDIRGVVVLEISVRRSGLKACRVAKSELNDIILEQEIVWHTKQVALEAPYQKGTCTIKFPITFDYKEDSSGQ